MAAYRHEYKYLISDIQRIVLINKARSILKLDSNVNESGRYRIRSLYFDDYYNRCYYENENGVDPREKYRIRTYHVSDSIIKLENKRKEMSKTYKRSCRLDLNTAQHLINGEIPDLLGNHEGILMQLICEMRMRYLHPVVIVEYERIPFVYNLGNVRITFDDNITASSDCNNFFDKDVAMRPILESGYSIMEVKFDDFLPDHIFRGLQLNELRQTAFSKYYLSRKFIL